MARALFPSPEDKPDNSKTKRKKYPRNHNASPTAGYEPARCCLPPGLRAPGLAHASYGPETLCAVVCPQLYEHPTQSVLYAVHLFYGNQSKCIGIASIRTPMNNSGLLNTPQERRKHKKRVRPGSALYIRTGKFRKLMVSSLPTLRRNSLRAWRHFRRPGLRQRSCCLL